MGRGLTVACCMAVHARGASTVEAAWQEGSKGLSGLVVGSSANTCSLGGRLCLTSMTCTKDIMLFGPSCLWCSTAAA